MDGNDYLMMSGLQHFNFCRRQWALIHIEQLWKENVLTAEGRYDHRVCHDESRTEKRNDLIIMRGMRVVSHSLGLSGTCDVVEFHTSEDGIELDKYIGKWKPVPVEYKHGKSKTIDADRLQLCAQGIALEEMLVCKIEYGFLFYNTTRQREQVLFSDDLRNTVRQMAREMKEYYDRGWTPSVKKSRKCRSCSLKDLCLPEIEQRRNVEAYIEKYIQGEK